MAINYLPIDYTGTLVYAFITTVAFAVLFHAPRNSLVTSGLIGGIGWVIFVHVGKVMGYSSFFANFFATVFISLSSEVSARLAHQPATIFMIPGVIPLVPGLGMYQGMMQIIEKGYEAGMATLLTAATDAMAIALGMMLMTSVFRVIALRKTRKFHAVPGPRIQYKLHTITWAKADSHDAKADQPESSSPKAEQSGDKAE